MYLISTIPYIPHAVLIALIFYVFLFRRKKLQKIIRCERRNINRILVFIGFAFSFFCIGTFDSEKELEFPYFIPIIISFLIGAALEPKDLRIIVYFLIAESVVGIVEFASGITTFLPGVSENLEFEDENILYFHRVMGLCKGSSTFAVHLLLGLLLLQYQRKFIPVYLLFSFVICAAILCTFNRTILIVSIPFEVYILYCYVSERFANIKFVKHLFFITLFVGIIIVVYESIDLIAFQLTRGGTDNVMTGRPLIWSNYWKFINENFFFGNFGYRTLLPYYGVPNHAHNSFIQLTANVGIPLALFFLSIFIIKMNRSNFKYILPIFVASLAQYEIFWGISFADIILFYFISSNVKSVRTQ